ncbi:ubiquitin carboxyl-terminal hydrolase 25-like isoform X3 [Camellia sinensis]|uniref:ubiquitin carboxyl-terminal hydrolase 25-like isoform X1 n=1 Tax=Camellia sinensis TaxID=4442 RepID=UPI00103653FA|nr:ubiquitin carboxyl-terminal hydrolase 25-like isoform X1 [Camellia sinensis]XP_028092201.1 ubiquitin carboxyl-terminal hydrolase 25-like isoform X2 [Camellia sinensis]XP_028092202.1 ubiquitin carboxyl-terminal hydrolase 25-like isoform X3 [Camellia sinensis]
MALQMTWQPSLLHHKRKNGPPLGLKNIGNSCYLNSVLQCLTYTPPLANFCLKFLHSSSCDSGEQERKRECPFCILEKRIARSLKVDLTLDTPSKMNNCLRVFADHFRCGRQEDAHEFLRYVIDACHNACLRLKKLQQQQQRRKGGANEGFNGSTVVMEIFGGALQSQVKCLSCGAESNKVDEIMDINLDVSHSSSLKESLQKFFQAEVLDGNNKYKCENCKKLVSARKQMSLLQAPNVLVIQLKRFEGMYGGKIDKAIAFEEVLVLSSYMCKANQDPHPEYNLFGTIVHSGFSPDSGHYYAYIKDAMGRWYCCNDSYIKLSNLQEVLSERVYILFFSRTKQRPVPTNTALASNGVKSQECNGSDASKSQKVAHSTKAVSTKQTVDHSFVQDNLTRSKVNKALSGPQDNLSGFGNSATKKFPATVNGKIVNKSQSNGKSGDLKPSISMEKGEKNTSSVNGNGVTTSKTVEAIDGENSHAFPSANGNGKSQSAPVKSVEAGMPENSHGRNGLTTERGANRHELQNGVHCPSKISGSKRKSLDGDSCILFAKDIHSQEKLKEFKEVLGKEVSAGLRSCGWTEEVCSSMRSRKKVCSQEAGDMASTNNGLKKLLITDAKRNFVSQIPESLKENLIQRLKSFSWEK